jgi:hypothetical protein
MRTAGEDSPASVSSHLALQQMPALLFHHQVAGRTANAAVINPMRAA